MTDGTAPALALAHLSALDLSPRRLLRLAAAYGFASVSLRLSPAAANSPFYPVKAGSPELNELRRISKGEGAGVSDIEIVSLSPDFEAGSCLWMLETGAELGATGLCVTGDDPVRARLTHNFAALCELAGSFGIAVDLEYMRWRPVARLADALDVVSRAEQNNGHVLIDLLHHTRSGGTVEELAQVPAGALRQVQVSDAPALLPQGLDIIDEARATRYIPGTGELPLAASLEALRQASVFSIELPAHLSLPDTPLSERLSRSADWLRQAL